MDFLEVNCTIFPHTAEMLQQSQSFSCGDKDLDDFFIHDAFKYEQQLLGRSYCFRLDSDYSVIVCIFTLSNSSIDTRNLPNNRKRKLTENIPHEKNLSSYPATLIGRLAVNKEFGGKGIGTELMNFIKSRMLDTSNLTACRYLTVDAYNNDRTSNFYENNGFKTLFSSDKQEKEYIGLTQKKELNTRLMYFSVCIAII